MNTDNEYNKWNEVKKLTNDNKRILGIKAREIFWARIGQNIGFEQNGKGKEFIRPVLIYKKFTKDMFLGIPLSTSIKEGNFFYNFTFIENKPSSAILVQTKLFSTKRLLNKIGKIDEENFDKLKKKYLKLIE